MKFVEFDQQNDVLNPHPNDVATVGALPIFRQAPLHVQRVWNCHREQQGQAPQNFPDGPTCVISAWQPDEAERAVMLAALTAGQPVTIFLQFKGTTHSPVSVWGTSPWAPAPVTEPVDDGGLDAAMEYNANHPDIGGKREPEYAGDVIPEPTQNDDGEFSDADPTISNPGHKPA